MKIVRTLKLWFREGTSDKVYEVDLVDTESPDTEACFIVNFRYGRRGQVLRDGTKTPAPVSRAAAEKVFDSVVVSKVNDGYRRADGGDASTPVAADALPSEDGREKKLLAYLDGCLRDPWPEKSRDRLFWRVGELRFAPAAPFLLQIAHKAGLAQASYSLVWALARCAGGEAANVLAAIGAEAPEPLVGGLARFALISPLMGEQRHAPHAMERLPVGIAHAIGAVDPDAATPDPDLALPEPMRDRTALIRQRRADALYGALSDLAEREPLHASAVLVDLYRLAQGDAALHGLLVALVARLPVRPPYVPALRRLFKYAEMIDDGAMFGAVARRFDLAKPMYAHSWCPRGETVTRGHVVEIPPDPSDRHSRYQYHPLTHLTGAADAKTALSENTVSYLKRRVWRAMRKRGETGQNSFLDLATGYLLAFTEADNVAPRTERLSRWENRRSVEYVQYHGPLAHVWSVGQLLFRHTPGVTLRPARFNFFSATEEPDETQRGEAFRALWDTHPGYALHLVTESRCETAALFGMRVLGGNAPFMQSVPAETLETLLASPFMAVARFALGHVQLRLVQGEFADSLITALLASGLPEARDIAIKRIELAADWPWASLRRAFIAVTSVHDDVQAAALKWCAGHPLPPEIAETLAPQLAAWLMGAPDAARIQHLRACLPLLWPAHDLPLSSETIARLMAHDAAEVRAAGVAMLAVSNVDAGALPDTLWQQLLNSPAPEIQAAALGLLARLSDEQLAERAFLVVSMATAPATEVRKAARPLIARLAVRFPRLGNDLAARLIDTLFQSAPDDAYAADAVALFREALPVQFAALDANLIWRLLHAKAKGAQLLGAAAITARDPAIYSVRQLARLGNHAYADVRQWVMTAYDATPERFRAEAPDAVLLIESQWDDARAFAVGHFDRWPDDAWTPDVLAVIADSTKPEILVYARSVLRRTMKPGDASTQLIRLLEHPATSMHLLISEVLTADAARDETVFAKLLPLSHIILLQVRNGRVAKDRIGAFLHAQALLSRERAAAIAPLFLDMSLLAMERDRTRAVTALRDIENAWPGLTGVSPLKRVTVAVRTA